MNVSGNASSANGVNAKNMNLLSREFQVSMNKNSQKVIPKESFDNASQKMGKHSTSNNTFLFPSDKTTMQPQHPMMIQNHSSRVFQRPVSHSHG
jgi:hypothetical protein